MHTIRVLTPAQQESASQIIAATRPGNIIALKSTSGCGRTTVLQHVHAFTGGHFLGMRQFLDAVTSHQPAAIEEAFLDMLDRAVAEHKIIILDDLHLVMAIVDKFRYPRAHLLDAALTAVLAEAAMLGRTLIFGVESDLPWPIQRRAYIWTIDAFTADDYRCLCEEYLGAGLSSGVDYRRIHRFAPELSARQLRNACIWLRDGGWSSSDAGDEARPAEVLDTERFIDYLRERHMLSNVKIDEVQRVDWNDLKGADEVIRALETKIALPFENCELAERFELKPKRGVLLAGPPGTGKTTIGRALAHRLKSKFFLIDGTFIADTECFYSSVREIFEAAKKNAPSVIFIDDADVIFENNEDHGLYRYLLTMLDGLESVSASRVCVIMTAMNVSGLPRALVRSGRVELWLETRLPDHDARAAILRANLAKLPPPFGIADIDRLSAGSRNLTGADLKAVVEDAKLLYAHAVSSGGEPEHVEEYFIEAIETIRRNQTELARHRPSRLPGAAPMGFLA